MNPSFFCSNHTIYFLHKSYASMMAHLTHFLYHTIKHVHAMRYICDVSLSSALAEGNFQCADVHGQG